MCQSAVFPVRFTSPVLPSVRRDTTYFKYFSHLFLTQPELANPRSKTSSCDVNTRGLFPQLFCFFGPNMLIPISTKMNVLHISPKIIKTHQR